MADYTEHYQLHQWQPQDKFLRTDFNEDLQKIDTALEALRNSTTEQSTALAQKGNSLIVQGSYTGNGTSGSAHKSKLTFDRPPLLIIICPHVQYSRSELDRFVLLRNAPWSFTITNSANSTCTITWSGNSVSWYGYNDFYQANRNGEIYHYIAFFAADKDA